VTLAPLIAASPVIQAHVLAAILALFSGLGVLLIKKGTPAHVVLGRGFVALMLVAAISSFWITGLRPGHFSWIHTLSVVTLVTIPLAVWRIRRGAWQAHAFTMIGNFVGLLVAGLFALMPERLMGQVFLGGATMIMP